MLDISFYSHLTDTKPTLFPPTYLKGSLRNVEVLHLSIWLDTKTLPLVITTNYKSEKIFPDTWHSNYDLKTKYLHRSGEKTDYFRQ